MREIVLDTETTGLNPDEGHRIIEIGGVELVNHVPSGKTLHCYINPERDIEAGAEAVHGIKLEMLADKPVFAGIADKFLGFVGDARLVIHNAAFDMGFINAELKRLGKTPIDDDQVTCTLQLARRKFPGAQNSLDALCRRFEIDNSHRDLHGALVDADLLAAVYIELMGGRQPGLWMNTAGTADRTAAANGSGENADSSTAGGVRNPAMGDKPVQQPRPHEATAEEQAAHEMFLDSLNDPLWRRLDQNRTMSS